MGLAGFALSLMLVVLFLLINKYGGRSKFGMKGKSECIFSLSALSLILNKNHMCDLYEGGQQKEELTVLIVVVLNLHYRNKIELNP